MTRRSASSLDGAVFLLFLLHVLALLAAATTVAHRLAPRFDRGGVFVDGFVPPRASALVGVAMLVAYGVAVALLYQRLRIAWWFSAALAGAGLAFAVSDTRDWLPNVAVLVLLAMPSVRQELTG